MSASDSPSPFKGQGKRGSAVEEEEEEGGGVGVGLGDYPGKKGCLFCSYIALHLPVCSMVHGYRSACYEPETSWICKGGEGKGKK